MIREKNITGIILAGGRSSRMGKDKGLLKMNDKYFVQYIIDALKPLVSDFIIVSENDAYDVFGYNRIKDIIKDSGPVAGIYSGLLASKTDYNFVLSCDIPFISTEILEHLISEVDETSEIFQIESQGKTMPLIAIYKKSVVKKFQDSLSNNELRLRFVVNNCHYKNIELENSHIHNILNINTKEEFNLIENVNNH